jgi:hypothetical protein
MNALLCAVLIFVVTTQALSALDPNGQSGHVALGNVAPAVEGYDDVCGTAQLYFNWNMEARVDDDDGAGLIYFFNNGTFYDYTYDYYGPWWNIRENGDDIFFFEYPTVVYVAPTNDARGSMIQRGTFICGSWFSSGWKWLCDSTCGV